MRNKKKKKESKRSDYASSQFAMHTTARLNKPEMVWMSRSALKSALLSFTAIVNDPLTYPQYRSASRSATVTIGPGGLQVFPDDVNAFKNTSDDAIDSGTHSSINEKYFALLPQFWATRVPIHAITSNGISVCSTANS